MPAHVNNASEMQYPKEQVRAYYKALLYLAELPGYWLDRDEIEEFLDTGYPEVSYRPKEFEDFCEAYEWVRRTGAKLGIEQVLSERKLRALARNLYYGNSRRAFYIRFLKGRIRQVDTVTEVSSIIEVEERYQYYLYRKESRTKGHGIGPKFKTWLKNGGCPITFYSIMSK